MLLASGVAYREDSNPVEVLMAGSGCKFRPEGTCQRGDNYYAETFENRQ